MRFTPIAETAAPRSATVEPFPPGDYDFIIETAKDTISQSSGNPMMALVLYAFNANGTKRMVWDYLFPTENWQWKVRRFAAAVGMLAEYERGELDPDRLPGLPGLVRLSVEPAKGDWPAKNRVEDYLLPAEREQAVAPKAARPAERRVSAGGGSIDSDVIPFAPCWQ